jgi:hypothetical protein
MRRLLLIALALGTVACASPDAESPAPLPAEQAESWEGYGSQTVVLFFAEGGLEPTWREELRVIELAEDPSDRVAATLAALFAGPERGLGRAFPPGMAITHLFLEEDQGLLTLDFHPTGIEQLRRAGSIEERIALEALKQCLRVNFPALRRLRILVGGETVATFGGHLNISRPLNIGGAGK